MDKRQLGRWGEEQAAQYLENHGFEVLAVNFSTRFGEIDVIARNAEFLAFVEVKLRKNASFAEAREFVTRRKQERIIATAELWLQANPQKLQPRFDVIEIYAPRGDKSDTIKINHIENAFM